MHWPGLEKILLITLPLVLLAGIINFFRPLPRPQLVSDLTVRTSSPPAKITWPGKAQAAIGAVGYGVFDATPTDQAMPTASVAKVMTALAVLKQKPLQPAQQGPMIKLTQADVDSYQSYLAKDGTVVTVTAGEKISEYQALEAMLIPSANNMADSLARWAFGSVEAYATYANQLAKQLGMRSTNISDASGFSPQTVSTAYDLVLLGQAAKANPVIAKITGLASADVPVAGTIQSTNWLLGKDGINGIKTGHTDQAGGCFLFSSHQTIGGQDVTLIGAIMDAHDSTAAINDALPLLKSARLNLRAVNIAEAGQTLAHYQTAWDLSVPVIAKERLAVLSWNGQAVQTSFDLSQQKTPVAGGTEAGKLIIKTGNYTKNVKVYLKDKLAEPPGACITPSRVIIVKTTIFLIRLVRAMRL